MGPKRGRAEVEFLKFENCTNVEVRNCDLFGCGTEAFLIQDCEAVRFDGCCFRECTYYIGTIVEARNVQFTSCMFSENEEWRGIRLANSRDTKFLNCAFRDNRFKYDFFEIFSCKDISIESSEFVRNHAARFGLESIHETKNKYIDNTFGDV